MKENEMNGPCPKCGQHTLRMTDVRYSCPLQFTAVCNCGFFEEGEGEPIKVLSTEEHIKKRPEMYLGRENPEWDRLAKEEIERRKRKRELR